MSHPVLTGDYSPVGDLIVVSVCFAMVILMLFSYVRKSRSFGIFLSLIGFLVLTALSDVAYHSLLIDAQPRNLALARVLRCTYHALLFSLFVHFVIYIAEVTRLERRKKLPFIVASLAALIAVVAMDILSAVRGQTLEAAGDAAVASGHNIFSYGYLVFIAIILVMMANIRTRLYKRVMLGFYGSMALSFAIQLIQRLHGQSSFTVATFLYPVIAMFYIMHSSPYDVELGAIDSRALEDQVRYNYEKKRDFIFMSLYLRNFDEEGKPIPEALQAIIRTFAADFFRGATLFQAGRGHVILVFTRHRNPDYEQRIQQILVAFDAEYQNFKYDYKIVIGQSIEEISRKNEYISFIRSIHLRMNENSIHRVTPEDVTLFNRIEFILRELADIYRKRDLDDPRVLAYCQPVFNIKTRRYDTAEALMRLRLDEAELVPPAQFIPLAEENGYIHVLTEIILHKTCEAIRRLLESGYQVCRISVNVSVPELKDDRFCADILEIIDSSGIPSDKIALELTESQSDSDFILMKNKIHELRQRGIKFYLDDFGTGYSNMERIVELPFDIIKFDRSLVIASGSNDRSRKIVFNLANMFSEMNYSVLYEGVEKDSDEKMCMDMSASYLQGYKYSRPVPIEALRDYFDNSSLTA